MADEQKESDDTPEFTSKLSAGRERFLSHVLDFGLSTGRRTADDFIRHFPPDKIMTGLKNQPRLRANILVLATGLKQRIALKKSATSAAEDLQIALDESETDAESVVTLFEPDDRVRYLDAKELWAYVIEGEFWTASPTNKDEFKVAKQNVAFMLSRALTDKLVTHEDVVAGVTVAEIAARLPKAELGKIIAAALENSRKDSPFRDSDLLAAMPPEVLVDYVPLPHLYKKVIVAKIAQEHGYVEAEESTEGDPAAEDEQASADDKPAESTEASSKGLPPVPKVPFPKKDDESAKSEEQKSDKAEAAADKGDGESDTDGNEDDDLDFESADEDDFLDFEPSSEAKPDGKAKSPASSV